MESTSDERHEVAERLREYPFELTKSCHTDPLTPYDRAVGAKED
jgi:sugar phosphate isomerase/epimerase